MRYVIWILFFLTLSSTVFALEVSSKKDCVICHVMWISEFRTEKETLIEFQQGNVLMKDTQGVVSSEDMCFSCHDGYVQDSRNIVWKFQRHKVFVKPSDKVTVPPELPLSVNGELYCGTCHSAHGEGASSHADPGGRTSLFREHNIESGLCEKCHTNKADNKLSNGHPLHSIEGFEIPEKLLEMGSKRTSDRSLIICQSCHRVHGAEGDNILVIDNRNSELCVICHEKNESLIKTKHDLRLTMPDTKNIKQQHASESGPCGACHAAHNAAGQKLWSRPLDTGSSPSQLCIECHKEETDKYIGTHSHPVDIDILATESVGDVLPLSSDDGMTNARGSVQCFTCHDVHMWDPDSPDNRGGKDIEGDGTNSFLRISNSSSDLCLECHADKKQVLMSDHNLQVTAPEEKNILGVNAGSSGPCGGCHVPHNAETDSLWAKKLSGNGAVVSELCTSCHSENGVAKSKTVGDNYHPVDVTPDKDNITSALPLFDDRGNKTGNGKMVCMTCHDPHIWGPDKSVAEYTNRNEEGDSTNSFLRISNSSSDLCLECHTDKKQVLMSDHNLQVTAPEEKNILGFNAGSSGPCGGCHVPHNAETDSLWAKKLSGNGAVVSELCTSCHSEKGVAKSKTVGDNYHPVDVTLDKHNITSALPLFDDRGNKTGNGKMVCMTCHDPHIWDPDKPVAEYTYRNEEGDGTNSFLRQANSPSSDLCVSCHNNRSYVGGTDHDLNVTDPLAKNILDQTVKESGTCGACHVVHNGPYNIKLWARPFGPVYNDESLINALCTSCHSSGNIAEDKMPRITTHPADKMINNILQGDRKAADFMPVYDQQGREKNFGGIGCPSCHNVHQWSALFQQKGAGENIEGNASNSFLRNVSFKNICTDCHGIEALFKFKFFHDPDKRTVDDVF